MPQGGKASIAAVLLSLALASPAVANSIPVTTTDDVVNPSDGFCSLREAVNAANSDSQPSAVEHECPAGSGADTITLGTATYTITRDTVGGTETANAEDDLNITSDVTIHGQGPAATTIKVDVPGENSRAIGIDLPPSVTAHSVTIEGVTITGGRVTAQDGLGGGVYANIGNLTLKDCAFVDNKGLNGAPGTPGTPLGGQGTLGGAVAIGGTGALVVDGCRFEDNHAGNGGQGNDDTGSANGGNGGQGGNGGAIWVGTINVTISNSTFVNNTAGNGGDGGHGGDSGDNAAGGVGGQGGEGGALYAQLNFQGTTFTDTTFTDNAAGDGGDGGRSSTSGGRNGNGGAGGSGGAVRWVGATSLVRDRFESNSAGDGGQGGDAGGNATNQSIGGAGGSAGAFTSLTGAFVATDSTFAGNSAGDGSSGFYEAAGGGSPGVGGSGGALVLSTTDTTFDSTTISGNTAGAGGPAVQNGNGGSGGSGGGLVLASQNPVNLTNTTISGNSGGRGADRNLAAVPVAGGAGGRGGGISLAQTTTLTGTHVTIAGNVSGKTGANPASSPPVPAADNPGGAISTGNGSANFVSSVLAGNGAFACSGSVSASSEDTIAYDPVSPGCPGRDVDPLLGPLANNGGPTLTMALGAGSSALDIAPAASCPATDQRGITRPQGSACDAGAFELEVAAPPPDNGGGGGGGGNDGGDGGGGGGGNEPPPDTTPPIVKLLLLKPHIANALKNGYSTVFSSNEKGTATVELRVGRTKVGHGSKALTKAGRQKVVVSFTKKARKKYRKAKKLKLTVLVTVTDGAGNHTLKKKTLTLKR